MTASATGSALRAFLLHHSFHSDRCAGVGWIEPCMRVGNKVREAWVQGFLAGHTAVTLYLQGGHSN